MKNHILYGILFLLSMATYGQNKLLLSYDASGNQTGRLYCEGNCFIKSKNPVDEESEEIKIAETIDESIVMYPNPTSGILNLQWGNDLTGKLENFQIYNQLGALLYERSLQNESSTSLDFGRYPSGIYLVRISFQDRSSLTRQIIKR